MNWTRHLLICGATGSGKTNTLRGLLAGAPVPALTIDCKGDLPGQLLPLQLPLCSLGPARLADIAARSPVQGDTLSMLFSRCEAAGQCIIDLGHVRAGLQWLAAERLATRATIAAVERGLSRVAPFAEHFRPDVTRLDAGGRIDATRTIGSPEVYSVFVDWILAEMLAWSDAPLRLIVAIDEAHLIRADLERALRLLRSRGVGIVLATQSPEDLSEGALANCGSIICHAIRVRTPRARARAEVLAAETGATVRQLGELPTGAAWTSILDDAGRPEKRRIVYECHNLPESAGLGLTAGGRRLR